MSKDGEFASLIPQVFFDIIARVIPGVALLAIYMLVYLGFDDYWKMFKEWLGPSSLQNSQLPSVTILFLLSFVSAYVLSITLWGLRFKTSKFFWKLKGDKKKIDCETGIKFKSKKEKEDYYIDYCHVKKNYPEAGARITKLKAEIHMTMTLSSGLVLAFFGDIILVIAKPNSERYWLALIILLMFLGSEFACKHFRNHMQRSIKNVRHVCDPYPAQGLIISKCYRTRR